jgi:3'(2'), 5'-bisphosphate nucleotidase
MAYSSETEVVFTALTQASKICQQVRHTSPVTIADFASQAIICAAIRRTFPHDQIIGEEDGQMLVSENSKLTLKAVTAQVNSQMPGVNAEQVVNWINYGNGSIADRYWTLDPIDGTKGFIRGDQYAIALALIEDQQPVLGAIACPALENGVIFYGIKGEGASKVPLNNEPGETIKVNALTAIEDLQMIASVEVANSNKEAQELLRQKLGATHAITKMDSSAKYGVIAMGQADLYVRIRVPQASSYRENIWDHAAGEIIIKEAGGQLTDLDGKPLDYRYGHKYEQNRGILATNGVIHDRVLAQIKALGL